MQNRVSMVLKQPFKDLNGLLSKNPNLPMDEKPAKQANQKSWLWTALAANCAVFAIFASRAQRRCPNYSGTNFGESSNATVRGCTHKPNDSNDAGHTSSETFNRSLIITIVK